VLEDVGGVVLMNPGSPAIPKYEVEGRLVPSVGLITDSAASIIDLDSGAEILRIRR